MWDKWTRTLQKYSMPQLPITTNPNIPQNPTILQKNPKVRGQKLKQKLGYTL
jgi:hypothetical protein